MSQSSNLVPENIYSQVVAPQNRNQNEETYSQSQNDFYNDQDPVYMNTPYNGDDDQYLQYDEQENDRRYNWRGGFENGPRVNFAFSAVQ